MEIFSDVEGKHGIDCGGFCEFCFYKNVDFNNLESLSIGCINCPPNHIGVIIAKTLLIELVMVLNRYI